MRVRFRFTKLGKVRWTSHRDVARMWERACRRIQLPLAYTEGFSPRQKMHFGLALPTGAESMAEYLDLDLMPEASVVGNCKVDVDGLPALLSPALPAGVDATAVAVIEARAPSLQEEVASCTWHLSLFGDGSAVAELVDRALAAPSLLIERERKGERSVDDVRPGILELEVLGATGADVELHALLATRPRGLRPLEMLRALDPSLEASRVCRINQWIERDGPREEPLAVAPHAVEARAQ